MYVFTKGVNNCVKRSSKFAKEVMMCCVKFNKGDWGETKQYKEDCLMNDEARKTRTDRVLAKYTTSEGDIYIIQEFFYNGMSKTTVLFTFEY